MNATRTGDALSGRLAPECAAAVRRERLANWLALLALLALGIVWQ